MVCEAPFILSPGVPSSYHPLATAGLAEWKEATFAYSQGSLDAWEARWREDNEVSDVLTQFRDHAERNGTNLYMVDTVTCSEKSCFRLDGEGRVNLQLPGPRTLS